MELTTPNKGLQPDPPYVCGVHRSAALLTLGGVHRPVLRCSAVG
jgi:hypothetical protein